MLDVKGPDRASLQLSCGFLFVCTSYYDYAEGYMPGWPDMDRFAGRIVHPQKWPDDLRYEQAGRGDRQRGDCGDARSDAGARRHAATLADLHRRAPVREGDG